MSWNINKVGLRAGVKKAINADPNVPEGIKQVIAAICDEEPPQTTGVRVQGFGHSGGGYGSIGKLEVEPVDVIIAVAERVVENNPDEVDAAVDTTKDYSVPTFSSRRLP